MIKWVAMFVAGAAIGAGAVLLVMGGGTEVERAVTPGSPEASLSPAIRNAVPEARDASLAEIQELPNRFDRIAATYDLLRAADVQAVEDLLEEADALPGDDRSLRWVIYSRYVRLAPRVAADRLLAEGSDRRVELMHALATWASDDFDAALEFVDKLEPTLRGQTAAYILSQGEGLSDSRKEIVARRFSVEPYLRQIQASAEARTDPARAWQDALLMEEGETRTRALWSVAATWLSEDPAAALSALDALADQDLRSAWQRSLVRRWAGMNRDAAWAWVLGQPRSETRTRLLGEVAAAVAEESPSEILEVAGTLDARERRTVAKRALQAWGRTEPRAALSELENMADPRLTQTTQHLIVSSWARSDPRAAFDWVLAQPPSPGRSAMITSTLGDYASSDPQSALALAGRLDEGYRPEAVVAVIRQWARKDPAAAAAGLDSVAESPPSAVAAVVQRYAKSDSEAAFNWLLDQSIGAQRQSIQYVIQEIAAESPQTARRLMEGIDDRELKQEAGSSLISTWVETDPRAAVRAIAGMDDEFAPELYHSAFQTWSGYDREGAVAFLNRIPSTDRDGAVHGMLQQALFGDDFAFAERMYDRLVGEGVREQAARLMYVVLNRTDPERAERYGELAGLQLDEDGQIRPR